jgi:hypothetical protein
VDGTPRKPLDASSSTAFPFGHPSAVASGTRKPPEKVAATSKADAKDAKEETDESGEEG